MTSLSRAQQKYLPYVLAVALFMQILDATILNTALPKMAEALGESPLKMQWAVISYALTLAILLIDSRSYYSSRGRRDDDARCSADFG
ncbi:MULTISPECIES: hypothetical protein [Psychrobacter]|uniref:hypothetical protein n=1 Tax=Psychrobacter TaxID=497 RepID=UPI001CB7151D|nr:MULTISPECIES: hypothetical protein [Psychrobacter]